MAAGALNTQYHAAISKVYVSNVCYVFKYRWKEGASEASSLLVITRHECILQ